jgi:phosphatidylserine/phosphatidylglycerophosphate/cardiolipin synthase-like enzyme
LDDLFAPGGLMLVPISEGDDVTAASPLLRPGETCWRMEHADRMRLVVDAADYFRAAKAAMLAAKHTIYLIGWDFDTRIKLEPQGRTLDGPNKLGRFLVWLSKRRPDLRIYVLKWNLGIIQVLWRGSTPLMLADWMTGDRVHFRLDKQHPVAAAHHQKIIVVDDATAFCGGIDMTGSRWDTRDHRDRERFRRRPWGGRYGPWHDAATVVDGPAARALGDLARRRWYKATGEELEPSPPGSDPWPEGLEPTLANVDVAIARTVPAMPDVEEAREIEALYLAGIAAAERTIYLESQYFASRKIAMALARRLSEPEGPEVVVVNPRRADGWLEEVTMDSARAKLLAYVRGHDLNKRFRIYYPVTENGHPIYVHAKVMVIDDRLLRVGSSNLNNRSMGFDSECDLAMEVVEGDPRAEEMAMAFHAVRNDLLAEHLGVSAELVEEHSCATGSLIKTIEQLRGSGRSLRPLEPDPVDVIGDVLSETELVDPERPPKMWRRLFRRRPIA